MEKSSDLSCIFRLVLYESEHIGLTYLIIRKLCELCAADVKAEVGGREDCGSRETAGQNMRLSFTKLNSMVVVNIQGHIKYVYACSVAILMDYDIFWRKVRLSMSKSIVLIEQKYINRLLSESCTNINQWKQEFPKCTISFGAVHNFCGHYRFVEISGPLHHRIAALSAIQIFILETRRTISPTSAVYNEFISERSNKHVGNAVVDKGPSPSSLLPTLPVGLYTLPKFGIWTAIGKLRVKRVVEAVCA